MNLADWSGNQWVTMFSSEAEKIFDMTSQEVGEATETNPEAMINIADKANFKNFIFKCRAKIETYNVCFFSNKKVSKTKLIFFFVSG